MRRFYLVSYDIPDDRRRARVFKFLRGWGERVQFSVFCCQLNPRERLRLTDELKSRMNSDEDQTLLVDAGPVAGERPIPEIAYIGKVWRPEQRSQIIKSVPFERCRGVKTVAPARNA